MYFKPPNNKIANPFYYPLNEAQRYVEEAVTVEMEFKTDADGAAVVGSETKSRGMLVSGQKIRNKVYRLTFKNNNVMNQFMKTYDNKLDEGTEELEEGTPEYRAMIKRYKGSDMEKGFKILDKEGFRMGEQSDTLVRNMLKKHRGNVKKAAEQIMKDNPGMFDVNRMMMDDVQIDEAEVYKRPAKVSALGGQKFHAVVENGKIVAAGMTEKEARKMKKFGQQVRELPGAKVGQLVKEDVEQIDEAYEVTFQFKGSKTKFMSRVKEFQNSGAMTGFSELDKRIEGRPNMVKMTFKSKSDFNKFFSQGVSGGVVKVQENVELDEMSARLHYNKMVAQGKVGRGGRLVTPIDRKRFPNREKEGLEGPFRSRKSGQVYYYDKKAGKYYDPLSDMFLQVKDVMETRVIDNLNDYLAEGTD